MTIRALVGAAVLSVVAAAAVPTKAEAGSCYRDHYRPRYSSYGYSYAPGYYAYGYPRVYYSRRYYAPRYVPRYYSRRVYRPRFGVYLGF